MRKHGRVFVFSTDIRKEKAMKRIRNKILRIMVLQTLVLLCVMVMSVGTVSATPEFNYANWYKGMGMYSVIGSVMDGTYTPEDAFYTIILPAHNEGYVTQSDAELFLQYYPQSEPLFMTYGIISESVTGNEIITEPDVPTTPSYTIEDCDMNKYATTNVNIRTEPDGNAGLVGSIAQNEQAHITGKTSNGWYRLEYNGMTGFSVAKYFSDVKIEEVEGVTDGSETPSEPTSGVTSEPASEVVSEDVSETVREDADTSETETTEDTSEAVSEEPVSESETKTDIIEEEDVVSEEVSEVTSEDVETSEPLVPTSEEETGVLPYILIGAGVLICVGGAVTVVVLKKKKAKN